MVDLDSALTDEKLNEIGQVNARSIETALTVAGIPEPHGRRLMNVLYNRAHNDKAKSCTATQFWKIWQDETDMRVEVNLENLGLVGICTHVKQSSFASIIFVIDGHAYIQAKGASVRYWEPDLYHKPDVPAMEKAAEAVNSFTESVDAAEKSIVFIQQNFSPEPLDATTIYRNTRNLLNSKRNDNLMAGPSTISSTVTAEWIVENNAALLGRTIEVRRSPNIHPENCPNIKGILGEAWFEYGSAYFVIDGVKCADELKAECLVWEPRFCDYLVGHEPVRRCVLLNNHRGEHTPVRPANR